MATMQPGRGHGGLSSSHFHLPSQLLMGLVFLVFGTLLLLKKIGKDFIPFIPEVVFIYICAIGSIIGGFYLIVTRLWRPRIIF